MLFPVTLSAPNYPRPPCFPWFESIAFHIFELGGDRDFTNLVSRFIVASPSPWMTNQPWKGRGQDYMTHLNFGAPIISLEWHH